MRDVLVFTNNHIETVYELDIWEGGTRGVLVSLFISFIEVLIRRLRGQLETEWRRITTG